MVRRVLTAICCVAILIQEVPASLAAWSGDAVDGQTPATTDRYGADEQMAINVILDEENATITDEDVMSFAELGSPGCIADGTPETVAPDPGAQEMQTIGYVPEPQVACCRICTTGKACGNSCISRSFTCRVGAGCACNAGSIGIAPPVLVFPVPTFTLTRQSAYPRAVVGETVELTATLTGSAFRFRGELEARVSNVPELVGVLRGWDHRGVIGINSVDDGISIGFRHTFRMLVQTLVPGVHRMRVAFYDRDGAQIGPGGVYWEFEVLPLPNVSRLAEGWHSRWVSQSPYLAMRPGQVEEFWVRFANTGTETWRRGSWGEQVNLALNGDDKAPYRLGMAVDWLWDDRIATTTSGTVRPGEVAEFRFRLRAPTSVGVYYLNLRPVVDGREWLEDEGVFWIVDVRTQ